MIFQDAKTKNYAANLIFFFLLVYIVVNPWPHTTTIQGICLYASVLLFICLNAARKREFFQFRTPLFLSTIFLVGWVLVGLFFAVDKQNSMHDIYSHLFKYVMLYLVFVSTFDTIKKIKVLFLIVQFSIVLFVVYSILNFYLIDENNLYMRFFGNSQGMTQNLISIPIIFAVFLAVCRGATTDRDYPRILYLLLLVPLVSALVLTQARSAFLALAISSLLFLVFYKKILIPLVVIAFAGILILAPLKDRFTHFSNDFSGNLRLNHALLVFEVLRDYPLTGIGFGMETFGYSLDLDSYKKKFEQRYDLQYGQEVVLIDPHNMYTDILVRTGFPGFALYLFFVFSIFRMLWDVRLSQDHSLRVWSLGIMSSLVAYFVIGLFEPVFSHVHEFYFALMVSMTSMLWREKFAFGPEREVVYAKK